jgi:hypothetical protein
MKTSFSVVASVLLFTLCACSTTQKTIGQGMTSVVAQNVVRIATVEGLKVADFSAVSGKTVSVVFTGFADDKNRGILELLLTSRVEAVGGRVISDASAAQLRLEIAVLSAGNDQGSGGFIIKSERTESVVDLQLTIRDKTGDIQYRRAIKGEAKYEQTSFVVGSDRGRYKVKTASGEWEDVPNPSVYR